MFVILQKELTSYFKSSIAYFVIFAYLAFSMLANFYQANYFDIDNQGLISLFYFQPDIFIMIIPALTMKLWAEERKYGTIEILFTRPISIFSIILGKFFASFILSIIMLAMTFPVVISTSKLITLDYNMVYNSYLASGFMIAAFCALGCLVSSFCKNPVIAYILSVLTLWIIKSINLDFLIKIWGNSEFVEQTSLSINFGYHYNNFLHGQFSLTGVIYFMLIIIFSLWLNVVAIEYKKD